MTESNKPEEKDETAEPIEDDPIIELKDEIAVGPADDEVPIDLTEIVEESFAEGKDGTAEAGSDATTADKVTAAPEKQLKGDEEIIDLLQAMEEPSEKGPDETISEEAIAPAKDQAPIAFGIKTTDESKGHEAVIDLVDAAKEISVPEDMQKGVDDVSELTEDENLIDLTETAEETALETENIGEPVPDVSDSVIDFEDISEFDDDLIKETADVTNESDSEAILDAALKDDFADSLGIELDSEEGAKENLFDTGKVTNDQVEAALERVIKKMFYEKIDRLLVDTIEKTVKKEIERLKKALLDDATDSEK